jgi:hypothetical protein
MRFVADTNVIVSALVFGGLPRRVLELAEAGIGHIFYSQAIEAEVHRVLREKFGWDDIKLGTQSALFPCRSLAIANLVHQSVDILFANAALFRLRPPVRIDLVPPGTAFVVAQGLADQFAHGAAFFSRD